MNVLVLLDISGTQREKLEGAAPEARFIYPGVGGEAGSGLTMGSGATDGQVAAADVIIGNIPASRLAGAGRLKLLQLNSAGYDAYLAPGTMPAGASLCCAVGAYGQAVSEHVLAMVLSLMKRLPGYRDSQREHAWVDLGPVTTLLGAHVLVLGCGDIGGHFARLCSAMGAHVAGVRRHAGSAPEGFESVHAMEGLQGLLPEADTVTSFLPSALSTRGLAGGRFFASMKPGAYFANGGRGDLVDEDALAAALRSGHLAGAALDVTDPEPLPADNPLWDAPGALITPHVSGGFHLPCVLDSIVDIAAGNLRRLRSGEPLRNEVARG